MQSLAGMASGKGLFLALSLALCALSVLGRAPSWDGKIVMPTKEEDDKGEQGTRWAILIAGSGGYWNYRHQVPTYSTIVCKIMPGVFISLKLAQKFILSVLVALFLCLVG